MPNDHGHASRTQITGEAGAIRAGAFNPDLRDRTVEPAHRWLAAHP